MLHDAAARAPGRARGQLALGALARVGALRAAPVLLLCASLPLACEGDASAPPGATGGAAGAGDGGHDPLVDDDRERLARCSLEEPPAARPTRPPPSPSAWRAGHATRYLDLPVGTPLGGYGARSSAFGGIDRMDGRASRWGATFAPSAGLHDGIRADALVLEAGEERLVLVRTDVPLVAEGTLFALERALGPELRGRVILTASHSHASWAAWQPSLTLVPGIDRPRLDLHERAVETFAGAVRDALQRLAPARVGVAIAPDLDPEGRVSSDRRIENDEIVLPDGTRGPWTKDRPVWALRVDDLDGAPRVALIDWPLHGTVGTQHNPVVSTDAPGAIARALTAHLGYPVFHVQGAAGDVSPHEVSRRVACVDPARCLDYPLLELIGARAVELGAPLLRGVVTRERGALEVVTRSFRVGKSRVVERPTRRLWYPPYSLDHVPDGLVFDDAGVLLNPLDEFNVPAGAALCGDPSGGSLAPIEGTRGVGAYSSCADFTRIAPIFVGLFRIDVEPVVPVCDTAWTTASAVRIALEGEPERLLVTVPGEPTAPFTAYLRNQLPTAPERTLVVGYAQDHVGYVLTAEDWLLGGYEPSINVWGPLEGEQVLGGILEAAHLAMTPELEDPERGSERFDSFPWPPTLPVAVARTPSAGALSAPLPPGLFLPDTTALPDAPEPRGPVERGRGVARLIWVGGDPAIDTPEVIVEREATPGVFEPLRGAGGAEASTRWGAVVLTYTPEPLTAREPSVHHWAASWQATPPEPLEDGGATGRLALPLGRYRLRARGTALGAAGPTPYEVTSAPFDLVPCGLDELVVRREARALRVTARLGRAPGLRALRHDGPSDRDVPLPGPWRVTVTLAGGATRTGTVVPDAHGVGEVTLDPADVAAALSLEVRDEAGNGGVSSVQD